MSNFLSSSSNAGNKSALTSDKIMKIDSPVIKVERYVRPLYSSSSEVLAKSKIFHHGVVVTLKNGTRWLVHKLSDWKDATCVEEAGNMEGWTKKASKKTCGRKTLAYYKKISGNVYDLLMDNCITAADRMMEED